VLIKVVTLQQRREKN